MTGPPDHLGCPYCEPVDARRGRDQAETYAHLTGLTVRRVRALLGGATLTPEDVATALWSGCVEPGAADALRGGRLADLCPCRTGPGGPEGAGSARDARLANDPHAT